jgi:hypothetical protein
MAFPEIDQGHALHEHDGHQQQDRIDQLVHRLSVTVSAVQPTPTASPARV